MYGKKYSGNLGDKGFSLRDRFINTLGTSDRLHESLVNLPGSREKSIVTLMLEIICGGRLYIRLKLLVPKCQE